MRMTLGSTHRYVKTCSVNSDVKEAREDVKDVEGTWELLPKVRFLDAMTCFCQAVLK